MRRSDRKRRSPNPGTTKIFRPIDMSSPWSFQRRKFSMHCIFALDRLWIYQGIRATYLMAHYFFHERRILSRLRVERSCVEALSPSEVCPACVIAALKRSASLPSFTATSNSSYGYSLTPQIFFEPVCFFYLNISKDSIRHL